jgi:hypothetical protein
MTPHVFLDKDYCDVPCQITLVDGTKIFVWEEGVLFDTEVVFDFITYTNGVRGEHWSCAESQISDIKILSRDSVLKEQFGLENLGRGLISRAPQKYMIVLTDHFGENS